MSPSLELESLDNIDERLGEPLYPSGGGFALYKGQRDEGQKAVADSCKSLNRLMKEGYTAFFNYRIKFLLVLLAECRAIRMLREAQPAKKSYVREFKLDANSINYLPALVDVAASCDRLCRQYAANDRRIPLIKFVDAEHLIVDPTSDYRMDVKTFGSDLTMEILVRADFNGDGLEDLLLWINAGAIGGTWGTTQTYLLSRESPDGVLWVLDAEKRLCSRYKCKTDYDYPKALRRAD